ncbi:MAG: hypothetical protein PHT15_07990, partial [Gallionellaceae bacterium]|nr:hypothetical protein [Gallionellaceae bacterium]
IKVELSEIKVNMQGESRASVFFKQSYSADNHKDVVRKIMGLEKAGDTWLIVSELAAKVEAEPLAPAAKAAKSEPAPKAKPSADIPPAALAGAEQAAGEAVQAWAKAWSARDVAKYLDSYARDFKPADGMSHASWEAQRRERIGKAKNIKVELSEIKVAMQGKSRAGVSFRQSYSADNHSDVMHKKLELEKTGDNWLIVKELAAKK